MRLTQLVVLAVLTGGCAGSSSTRAGEPPLSAFVARRGEVEISITDGAGPLMDLSAPLPPPGTPRAIHPFLSGTCSGDPFGCSEARGLLEASRTTREFAEKLEDAGFTIEPSR